MRVAAIHEPVHQELLLVEAAIDAVKKNDSAQVESMLDHVLSAGGKRLRPTLALLAGHFGAEYRPERLVPLAASIELLHTATLVHDDVIDVSDTRRGRATTNARHHNAAAVMLGDYMFAHAASLICDTENLDVVRLFSRTLMSMASGELTQDMSAYQYGQNTLEYFHRIAGKTASLFATSTEGGAIVSGAPENVVEALRSYGESLGMAFQIIDDILDFAGDAEEMGKPVGSDLMEGTLTLPSLLVMERYPEDNPIEKLFQDRNQEEYLAKAIDLVQNSDVLNESRGVAKDFTQRAIEAIDSLPDVPARASLIDLTDNVLTRRA